MNFTESGNPDSTTRLERLFVFNGSSVVGVQFGLTTDSKRTLAPTSSPAHGTVPQVYSGGWTPGGHPQLLIRSVPDERHRHWLRPYEVMSSPWANYNTYEGPCAQSEPSCRRKEP